MELWVFFREPVWSLDLQDLWVELEQCTPEFSKGVAADLGWEPRSDATVWVVLFSADVLRMLLAAVPTGDLVVWDESEQELLRREAGRVTVQPHGYEGLDELPTA